MLCDVAPDPPHQARSIKNINNFSHEIVCSNVALGQIPNLATGSISSAQARVVLKTCSPGKSEIHEIIVDLTTLGRF